MAVKKIVKEEKITKNPFNPNASRETDVAALKEVYPKIEDAIQILSKVAKTLGVVSSNIAYSKILTPDTIQSLSDYTDSWLGYAFPELLAQTSRNLMHLSHAVYREIEQE